MMRNVVGCGLLVVLVACGGSSSEDVRAGDEVTSTTVLGRQPPGSEIVGGLVVPEGASLAGAVFPWQDEGLDLAGGIAHLSIEGDPFAVWDDLAGQLRELHPEAPMAGTADSCVWQYQYENRGGLLVELDGNDGSDTPEEARSRRVITAEAPEGTLRGIDCWAGASYSVDGAAERTTLTMSAGSDWRPTLTIDVQREAGPGEVRTSAQLASEGPGARTPTPVPVPEGAADHIPPTTEPAIVAEGEPFGGEVNCFSGQGYARTVLPAGATAVEAGADKGQVSVLAVDDARAVIEDLQAQFEGGMPDETAGIEVVDLGDGSTISSYSHGVSAGGGACSVRSSPDGRYLRIERSAD
jgi:hypothetical protein